jgi:hypothetical protein
MTNAHNAYSQFIVVTTKWDACVRLETWHGGGQSLCVCKGQFELWVGGEG